MCHWNYWLICNSNKNNCDHMCLFICIICWLQQQRVYPTKLAHQTLGTAGCFKLYKGIMGILYGGWEGPFQSGFWSSFVKIWNRMFPNLTFPKFTCPKSAMRPLTLQCQGVSSPVQVSGLPCLQILLRHVPTQKFYSLACLLTSCIVYTCHS